MENEFMRISVFKKLEIFSCSRGSFDNNSRFLSSFSVETKNPTRVSSITCLKSLCSCILAFGMKQNHKFAKKALALEKLHQEHEVIFAIKPKNIDKLEQTFKEVSDPNHENYGKYLTRDQIAELTRNEEGNKIVKEYVKSLNLSVQKESEYGDFITVTAPLSSWQTHLKTNFFEFKHDSLGTVHRAESPYELPDHVHQHVVDLFNVNDLPVEVFGGPVKDPIDQAPSTTASKSFGKVSYGGGKITPQSLYRYYNIKPSLGNNKTTQAAIQMDSQIVSTYDLNLFQQYYKLPTQKLARSVGGQVTSSTCPSDDYCDEANLDFQYIMAIGRSVATTSIYFDSGWLPIIQNLTSWNSPPKVISISYGSYETSMSPSYIQAFNTLAMQLGVMGTTVVVASGDDGATGFLTRDSGVCMYGPLFPASSPYVLSVGGTMGPEINATEVVSQANLGGIITSGGGFSFYSTIPDYQKTVVTSYLTSLASSSNMIAGYNTKGRGYPDISAAANNYQTIVGGKISSVSGTSASAPVVAGMISLINAQRALWGLSSMGFINTYLYTNYAKLATDVKSGNNSCTISGYQCCPQGFPATTGWDAASGLGSLNFTALYNMAVPQTSPAGKPTANTSIADKTGETAGTVFFVLAFVILAGVYALSWLKKPVRDRQASFVPVNHHDDQLDDTL